MRFNDARGPSSLMSFKASTIDGDGGRSSYDCAQIKGPVNSFSVSLSVKMVRQLLVMW